MTRYRVADDHPRIPTLVTHAPTTNELGHLIAHHLIRHKALRPALKYDARVDLDHGTATFTQHGLPKPVTVTVQVLP